MIHKRYEDWILYFKNNWKNYKSDYEINIERLDWNSCLWEFSKKDKLQIAQRISICKAIEEWIISDMDLNYFINKPF